MQDDTIEKKPDVEKQTTSKYDHLRTNLFESGSLHDDDDLS